MFRHDHGLLKAIRYFGSQSGLARALGIDPNRVNNWVNRDKHIPYQYAVAIEILTRGKIKREELAPTTNSWLLQLENRVQQQKYVSP
jgi:DNA-binding transcriptional regulator YdaS (Cro superfamily)